MRARFIFSFFMALFISTSAIYANTLRWGDIILDGEFSDVGSRSIHNSPISAFFDEDNTVYVEFSRGVTDVTITVKDNNGNAIYSSSTVASATNPGTSFSVEGYAPGSYTLEITNSDGGYLQGFFIVE
ncbi:DUF3244 domain-containing protein [Bacteroides sp.]